MAGLTLDKTRGSTTSLRSSSSTLFSLGTSSTSGASDYSLQGCCSETVATTNLTSSTLLRASEPTHEPTNKAWCMKPTDPVIRTVRPFRPMDLPVVVVDSPKHSPGYLAPGMEPEENMDNYMKMTRCCNNKQSASNVATLMTPAIHRQQQQMSGAARRADGCKSMPLSLSTDRLATGLQLRAADHGVCPATAFHPEGMDENGYMRMSCEVRKTCFIIF